VTASDHRIHAATSFSVLGQSPLVVRPRPVRLAVTWICGVVMYEIFMFGLTHYRFFEHQDKVVHVLASFLLSILLRWSLGLEPVAVAVAAICVGGLDEMLQLFQPGRHADPLDFLANVFGTLLACMTLALWLRPRCTASSWRDVADKGGHM